MIAPQRKYAPSREQVQIAPAFGIEKPRALTTDIFPVESDCADCPDERRVYIALVQVLLATLLSIQPLEKSVVHKPIGFRHNVPPEGCVRSAVSRD